MTTGMPRAVRLLYTRSKVAVRSCSEAASNRVHPAMFTPNGHQP